MLCSSLCLSGRPEGAIGRLGLNVSDCLRARRRPLLSSGSAGWSAIPRAFGQQDPDQTPSRTRVEEDPSGFFPTLDFMDGSFRHVAPQSQKRILTSSRHERSEGRRSCPCGADEVNLPDQGWSQSKSSITVMPEVAKSPICRRLFSASASGIVRCTSRRGWRTSASIILRRAG
jgi:hypothetical protein